MTDERRNIPVDGDDENEPFVDNFIENPEDEGDTPVSDAPASNGANNAASPAASVPPQAPPPRAPEDIEIPAAQSAPPPQEHEEKPDEAPHDDRMGQRLERLGGEPAPVITPEEFARLQKSGQVNIDSRGRVRTARPEDAEAGVSLRKRRAWYVVQRLCANTDRA